MKKTIIALLCVITAAVSVFTAGCNKTAEKDSSKGNVNGEPVSFSDTSEYLVKNKVSEYKIVIPKDATGAEKYAAEELSYFLEKSTACVLPVTTDAVTEWNNEGRYISVGNTELLKKQTDISVLYEELGDNGVTVNTRGNCVYIAGAADYGTLFSVYRFLHYQIGYKAYAYDHIEYDYFDELKLKDFDYKYKPALGTVTASDGEMYGKDKVKDAFRMYIYASSEGGEDLDGNLYNGLWCHTTEYLASPATYGHLWNNGQLCYSNPESAEVVTATLVNKYVNFATGPYLMAGGNDNVASCNCDDCVAGAAKYGGASGVYVRFLNKVAENVENYMREKGMTKRLTIVGLFYYAYVQPPVILQNGKYVPVDESVVPRSGQVSVGVMYTPIQSCYTHPFGEDTCDINKAYTEYIKGWAAITDHLMMYSYGTNFQAFKYHFNNWAYMGDTYRFFSDLGMNYYFEQSCNFNGISPMSSMRVFVRSSLAWNPYQNTADLINEFIEHYYGDGAEGVKEYFAAVMENFERVYTMTETECEGIYYLISKQDYWTRPVVKSLESYLEKSMFDVENGNFADKELYKERIFREYFLIKECEYQYYSVYLNGEELNELKSLVEYGREKYNAYRGAER